MNDTHVSNLKAMYRALKAQAAAIEAETSPEDKADYDCVSRRLKYITEDLKRIIIAAWTEKQALAVEEIHADAKPAIKSFMSSTDQIMAGIVTMIESIVAESTDATRAADQEKMLDVFKEDESVIDVPVVVTENQKFYVGNTVFMGEGSDPSAGKFRMLVIAEGMSGNKVKWPADVLRASVPLLEGRPIFVDHPQGFERGEPQPRGFEAKVGWWSDAKWVDNVPTLQGPRSGIVATANVLENSAKPWLRAMIAEALVANRPDMIGVSVVAVAKAKIKRGDDGLYQEALSISGFQSADFVAAPSAGGQAISISESQGKVDPELDTLATMTKEELKALRPDLFTEAIVPSKPDDAMIANLATIAAAAKMAHGTMVEAKLAGSGLPQALFESLRTEIGDDGDIDAVIAKFKGITDAYAAVMPLLGNRTLIAPRFEDGGVISPLDQINAALDQMFGNPNEKMKGKFNPITSLPQLYEQITGSHVSNGYYDKSRSVLGDLIGRPMYEALPGSTHVVGGPTITLPGIFGTSMNRALTKMYAAQEKWWTPIVAQGVLTNMKTQTRVRTHNFGVLPQRTNYNDEYTELDWGETNETFDPKEYGALVPVTRIAFINDDLQAIARIPSGLARAAALTLNTQIAALFTVNSGTGPALTDGFNVFDAANHQGNLVALALNYDNLMTARKLARKMGDDQGSVIGTVPRNLLVPIDLEETGFKLVTSVSLPGTANNDPNMFANAEKGVRRVISVPQWTDEENWYLMPDTSDIACIELDFLFGKDTPDLFTQDSPTEGIVFTHDVMNFKVRHDWGVDWTDYRGSVASVL